MIKYINRDALVHTLLDKGFYPVIVRNAIEATTVTDWNCQEKCSLKTHTNNLTYTWSRRAWT